MKVNPIGESIFFTFVNNHRNGFFTHENTDWGFELDVGERGINYDVFVPRWGLVKQVGELCKDVKVGDYILIEGGKWTNSVIVDDDKIWRTKEEFVIGTQEEAPSLTA